MGRRILGLRSKANNDVVYGELGWWPLSARRLMLRLRYWKKVLSMKPTRLTRILYDWELRNASPRSWSMCTKSLLEQLQLGEYWETQRVPDAEDTWSKILCEKIQQREQERWRLSINQKRPYIGTQTEYFSGFSFKEKQ